MKIIRFTKVRYLSFTIALLLIGAGITYGILVGPRWGIDFKQGLNMVLSVKDYDSETGSFRPAQSKSDRLLIEEVRSWFDSLDTKPRVQLQNDEFARYTLRLIFSDELIKSLENEDSIDARFDFATIERDKLVKTIEAQQVKVVEASVFDQGLVNDYSGRLVVIESSQSSSPSWTANSWRQLIMLLLIVLLLITIYIWVRFTLSYAVAATITLVGDILVMIGFIAVLPFEVSKTTIAALLTIVGYSLNDTIVIFDRIRENRTGMSESPLPVVINTSITQSLTRTIITSLTTLLAVGALFIFTEGDVKAFAANMAIGVIYGTFSSNFIAPSLFLEFSRIKAFLAKKKHDKKFGTTQTKSTNENTTTEGATLNDKGEVEVELIQRKQRRKKKK